MGLPTVSSFLRTYSDSFRGVPVYVNGRQLGVARNGVFNSHNTDPIPGGRLWPEAALTWNAMRLDAIADGIHPDEFKPGGPASSARSIPQQDGFWANQPPPAAHPGTSNHGWAIAVDCPSARAQAWLYANAHRYGWSHDEGLRVGEAWHFRYIGTTKSRLAYCRRRLHPDPYRFFGRKMKKWIGEYNDLGRKRRTKRRDARRAKLHALFVHERKAIWHTAQHDGWKKTHRIQRYHALMALTT